MNLTVFIRPLVKGLSYPLIEIPPAVADHFLGEASKRRIIITFPNGAKFHRAIQRNKNGFAFITLGKATLKEAGTEPGTEHIVKIVADNSKFGMEMPEEMEEVLNQDPEGCELFMKLKPGMQRSHLYYIGTAKTIETRINRSLKLLDELKMRS